ncbi:MAG: hypothetical protein AAF693_10790 [Bacteroidota bacterium]
MKKFIEKQKVFDLTLKFLSFLSNWKLTAKLIPPITGSLATLNLLLNKPQYASELGALANSWKKVMPPDGQEYFKISEITEETAFVEIHLHCPLRGTGKVKSCYSFMNCDRTLIRKIGGSLTVLESQSNSGRPYCKLAVRKLNISTDDLIPAHLKE